MAEVNKSRILQKIKGKTKGAWKNSRSKEATARGQQLPGGLVNAVAKFKKYAFGENDKKVPYVTLTGVCVEPAEYAGTRVSTTYRFEDTENKSVQDVCDNLSSDLQLLGADTEGTTEDDWERLLKERVEAGPYYYFNTREWEFNGRKGVSVFIQKLAADWQPEEEEATEEEEPQAEAAPPPPRGPRKPKQAAAPAPEPEPEPEQEEEEGSEEAPTEDIKPELGDIWGYQAGPKGTVKECEVTAIDAKARTVDLKRVEDNKVFKAISWDKLVGAE